MHLYVGLMGSETWRADDDRVTFAVGRVARSSARMESIARVLWRNLANSPSAKHAMPLGLVPLLTGCERMLPFVEHEPAAEQSCLAAVREAKMSHDLRNKLVHTQWELNTIAGDRWDPRIVGIAKQVPPSWALDNFDFVQIRMETAGWRLFGVELLGGTGDQSVRVGHPQYDHYLAIVEGDFELLKHGSIRVNPARASKRAD